MNKSLFYLTLVLCVSLPALGDGPKGPGANGGGGPIQSGFRTYAIESTKRVLALDPDVRQKFLKFDPFDVSRLANSDHFQPKCAEPGSDEQHEMEKNSYWALVTNPDSGVVYLNCTTRNTEDWNREYFQSERPEARVLPIHEILRIMEVETAANDYSKSAGYLAAVDAELELVRRAMSELIDNGLYIEPDLPACKIIFSGPTARDHKNKIYLYIGGHITVTPLNTYGENAALMGFLLTDPAFETLSPHYPRPLNSDFNKWRLQVYRIAKMKGCFDKSIKP